MDTLLQFLFETGLLTFWQRASSFIVVVSIIVFIHEFGHYAVAKLSGVKITAFSIGFGKELFGWTDKSGTRWRIAALPFGGYVKMFGDTNAASMPDSDGLSSMSVAERGQAFHYKSLPVKAAIVAAGPAANFLLAIVILTGFLIYAGQQVTLPVVEAVMPKSAAEEAGLQPGDTILALDGKEMRHFQDVQRVVQMQPEIPIELTYQRQAEKHTITIIPKLLETKDIFGNPVRVGMLGIQSTKVAYEEVAPLAAVGIAFRETYNIAVGTLRAVGQIIAGQRSPTELGGPIKIAKYSGQSMEQGVNTLLWFIAVLSINLGLINLFPIPVLDGGHLMYYMIEALRGKPLAQKYQEYGFRVGMALVLTLMVFVVINDLRGI